MCLGVPGRVVAIDGGEAGVTMGTVEFGGVRQRVCLECVPDVAVGSYVLVHVGFAIGIIDEDEAREVFELLEELEQLGELQEPEPPRSR